MILVVWPLIAVKSVWNQLQLLKSITRRLIQGCISFWRPFSSFFLLQEENWTFASTRLYRIFFFPRTRILATAVRRRRYYLDMHAKRVLGYISLKGRKGSAQLIWARWHDTWNHNNASLNFSQTSPDLFSRVNPVAYRSEECKTARTTNLELSEDTIIKNLEIWLDYTLTTMTFMEELWEISRVNFSFICEVFSWGNW